MRHGTGAARARALRLKPSSSARLRGLSSDGTIFQTCGAMIVNKIDVLPYFDFDLDQVTAFARQRNPDLEIFPISAKTGEGVEALADWLCTRIRTHKEKKKETNA